MTKARSALLLVAAGVLWLGAAPAGDPEVPIRFIPADELKAHLDGNQPLDLIDVRIWDEYVQRHIPGARSMPLRTVPNRLHEIRKTGLVVLY